MKQISVRVDDDFAIKFKMELLKRGVTAQEVLKTYLESWLANNIDSNMLTTQHVNNPTSEQVKISHVNKLTTTSGSTSSTPNTTTQSEHVNKLASEQDGYKIMHVFDEEEEEDTTCTFESSIPEWQKEKPKPKVIEDPIHEVVTNEQIKRELEEMRNEPKPEPKTEPNLPKRISKYR